jgi:DNA-directed RNA polymerase subunit RPC12/RpoP
MGHIFRAICDCGYIENKVLQGAGELENNVDMEPALCATCQRVVSINVKGKKKDRDKCPNCGSKVTFYNDPSLYAENYDSWHQWYDFKIPTHNAKCPKCGQMRLRFSLHTIYC